MVDAPHTSATHIEQSQSQKEVTANAAFDRVAKFVADTRTFSGVSADVTPTIVTPDFEWQTAVRFILSGSPAGPINFNAPASVTLRKLFVLVNNLGQTVTAQVTGGAGAKITLLDGQSKLLYSDGADIIQVAGDTSSGATSGLQRMPSIPFRGALARHSTTQAISAGVDTTVAFNLEDYDTDDFHDLSTNNSRMTIPPNVRRVRLIGGLTADTPSTGDMKMWITKNGAGAGALPGIAIRSTTAFAGGEGMIVISPVVDVVAGDHFELEVNFNNAGSLNNTGSATWFSIQVVEYNTVDPEHAFQGALAKRITSAQAISAATPTAIAFNSEDYDTDAFHDNSVNPERLTIPPRVRKVRLTGGWNSTTPGSGVLQSWIAKNGGAFPGIVADSHSAGSSEEEGLNPDTGVIDVVEGDFFELYVQFAVAGSITHANDGTFFGIEVIERVSPSLDLANPFRGARVGKSATEVSGAGLTVDWETEDYDTDAIHDPAANTRLTVPPGVTKVRLTTGMTTSTPSTGAMQMNIIKNAESVPGQARGSRSAFTGTEGVGATTPVLEVVAGDFFEVNVFTASAGVIQIAAAFFAMEIVEYIPTVAAVLPLNLYIDGVPTVSVDILRFIAVDPFLLPDDLDGSAAHVSTAPSGAVVIDVQKNGSSIGSISIATTGVATFSTTGSAVEVFNTGDRLSLVAPADWLTLADLTVTLRALLVKGV